MCTLSRSIGTQITCIWFLPCVHTYMFLQMIFCCSPIYTVWTSIWLLPCMSANVFLQMTCKISYVGTVRTEVHLVRVEAHSTRSGCSSTSPLLIHVQSYLLGMLILLDHLRKSWQSQFIAIL